MVTHRPAQVTSAGAAARGGAQPSDHTTGIPCVRND